ncbi:MAG: hypothetical protein E7591_10265 [Ruminococcaceae bacterium]|nr:hypothetical protein [Oscillospiraceae bacterium]
MKKILALLLAMFMLVSLTACGSKKTDEKDDKETQPKEEAVVLEGVEAPVDILNTVWDSYADDEKFFAMGGDANNVVDNAPGAFDITDTESLYATLVCDETAAGMIDGAASIVHGMIANNFTGAAYHLAEGSDMAEFTDAMKTAIEGNQWICGFPEKMLIVTLSDDYAVVAFGSADIVDNFGTKLADSYETAETVVDAPLA